MELGQTDIASELIPGDSAALMDQASKYSNTFSGATAVAEALAAFSPPDSWTGEAATAFTDRVKTFVPSWENYADACGKAEVLLSDFANSLTVAQGRAGDAIAIWNTGTQLTADAKVEHQRKTNEYWFYGSKVRSLPVWTDPGASVRAEAKAILAEARAVLRAEGDAAASRLERVAQSAPERVSWWALGAAFFQASMATSHLTIEDFLMDVGNGALSFGNALIQNPDILLELFAGIGGMAGGGLIIGGSGLATVGTAGAATPISVPAAAAGTGVFGVGAAAFGNAIMRAGEHAGSENSVKPFKPQRASDGTFARGNGGSRSPDWYAKEQKGLDRFEAKTGQTVIRDQIIARVDGAPNGRFFDGLVKNPDGTYTAIEVKSGDGRRSTEQALFDGLVSAKNPAYVKIDGELVKIIAVKVERV